MKPTIVLIHGAWLTPTIWDPCKHSFEKAGYTVLVPAWPLREKNGHYLGISELVDHFEKYISTLPEPPILIGHSFGGLVVQMLLDRGLGKAGIAISSVPAKGVFRFYPTVMLSTYLAFIIPLSWRKIIRMPFSLFNYSFAHRIPEGEQAALYKEQIVPESGRLFWQLAFASFFSTSHVNFSHAQRAPLLFIAGAADRVTPTRMNWHNYRKYAQAKARTDFKVFSDRCHLIIVQAGNNEVAEYCCVWIANVN